MCFVVLRLSRRAIARASRARKKAPSTFSFGLKVHAAARLVRLALPLMRVAGGGSIVNVLNVGAKAPNFKASAYLAGKPFTFKLARALKKGPVVVYFFPAAHTSGCNIEAHLFSEAIDQFAAQHATVIGVTAGNIDQLADFSKETEHCSGKFPVAADPGAKIAKQYDAILAQKPEWSDRTSYVISTFFNRNPCGIARPVSPKTGCNTARPIGIACIKRPE